MQYQRVFIAVDVSAEVQARVGDLMAKFKTCGVKVTWTKLHNLHLTLKFLGDTPETVVPDVCRAVNKSLANSPSFELHFGGVGAFPHLQRPQTLWLGVRNGLEEMRSLHRSIEDAMHPLRFPVERRQYSPHLTLGRTRGGSPEQFAELRRLLEEHASFDAGVSFVEEVIVFSSTLDRVEGPHYDVLSRTELT